MPELGQILDIKAAAARCNLSVRALEALLARSDGPITIQLCNQRIGFAEADLNAWLYSRRRTGPPRARVAAPALALSA